MIQTFKSIKELGVSLDDLYENKGQIIVHLSDKKYTFTVLLKNRQDHVDCKLSSFSANLWTRTEKGVNYEKYSRIRDLQTAIKKQIKSRVDTKGDITFSLSNEICYM